MFRSFELTEQKYVYNAPWSIFGMCWSSKRCNPNRFLIGSFQEDYKNKVYLTNSFIAIIVTAQVRIVEYFPESKSFHSTADLEHPYPATKVMFIPDHNPTTPDLVGI